MLEDIKNKKIDLIIIKDLSRLGRNYIETGNFIEVIFPAMGVSVISVDKNVTVMKKWNPEIDKENWIVTENHHEAIISKENFDKVQEILDRKSKVNKDGSIDLLFGILKCKCCGSNMIKRISKGKVYYYCSNYYRTKNCENNKSLSKSILYEIIKMNGSEK